MGVCLILHRPNIVAYITYVHNVYIVALRICGKASETEKKSNSSLQEKKNSPFRESPTLAGWTPPDKQKPRKQKRANTNWCYSRRTNAL